MGKQQMIVTVIIWNDPQDCPNFDQARDGEELPPDEINIGPVSGVQSLPDEAQDGVCGQESGGRIELATDHPLEL